MTERAAETTMAAMAQVYALVADHAWLALAVLVVGFLARLTAKDSRFPLNIPDQWQPVLVLALGTAADVLQQVSTGKTTLFVALNPALVIGVLVLAAKAYYHGKTEPRWLMVLAAVVPTKTTTSTVEGPATVTIPVPTGTTAEVEVTKPETKDPS